jgi:hypothetical protein
MSGHNLLPNLLPNLLWKELALLGQQREDFTNGAVRLQRVTKVEVAMNFVPVSPPDPDALQVAGSFKISNDPRRGALSDSNPHGHFAQANVGSVGNSNKHVCMV